MKQVLIFSLWSLMLFAVVVSCKKSDPAPASNPLIGSWKGVSTARTGCTDPMDNFFETCTDPECPTLVITATGYSISQLGSGTETGTYTVSGSSIVISGSGTSYTYTYAIAGSTLTFIQAPGADGCTAVIAYTKI